MENSNSFSRQVLLIGQDNMERLANASVFICGTGGVGSWVAEEIARSGIGHITVMDPDVVKPSNINRQLCALHSTIGMKKAEVIASRLSDINPEAEITCLPIRLEPEMCNGLLLENHFDCVIDAIDERPSKLALIEACSKNGIPIISSMGAANKTNASLVTAADISETHGCRLARIIRKSLRHRGIEKGVRVVFSPELSNGETIGDAPEEEGEKKPLGTISYMPAIFGLHCAAEAIRIILKR